MRVGWTLDHPAYVRVCANNTLYSIIYVLIDTLVELNTKNQKRNKISFDDLKKGLL